MYLEVHKPKTLFIMNKRRGNRRNNTLSVDESDPFMSNQVSLVFGLTGRIDDVSLTVVNITVGPGGKAGDTTPLREPVLNSDRTNWTKSGTE